MTLHRLASLAVLSGALAAAGCTSGSKAPPAAEPFGTVQAAIAAPPTAVKAVLVTVTAADIVTPMRTLLTADIDGRWSGRVVNVPPGLGRVVTAYAYSVVDVPEDPVADDTGLIFRGKKTNVMVTAGQLTGVSVPLLPYPDGGGETGINTPPHITSVTHAVSIASDATTTFSATAVDPDSDALLSYRWSDDGAGGTFSPAGGRVDNRPPGLATAIDYTPASGLVGTVTLRLEVSDGAAWATTTFPLSIGSGIEIGLAFDVLPDVELLGASDQDLAPGDTILIDYRLAFPVGAGPDAPPALQGTLAWSDDCGGTFGSYQADYTIWSNEPRTNGISYTAPAVAPGAPGLCKLTLTLTDALGAEVWTSFYVWVTQAGAPAADFTGAWTGLITEADSSTFVIRFDLVQNGQDVTGSMQGGWVITGTVSGQVLTFHGALDDGSCLGAFDGTGTMGGGATMDLAFAGSTVCGIDPAMTYSYTGLLDGSAAAPKIVFVTSTAVDGAFFGGSAASADLFCQQAAEEGMGYGLLPAGTWAAFLSFADRDARAVVPDGRFVLADGSLVAASRAELLGGTLQHAIDMTQQGQTNYLTWARTGSTPDGAFDPAWSQCANWTSNGLDQFATVGFSGATDSEWVTSSASGLDGFECRSAMSVYCIQQ